MLIKSTFLEVDFFLKMKVENRKFYFIKDEFFDIFKGYKLMVNKENGNENENIIKYNYGLISKIIKILLVK